MPPDNDNAGAKPNPVQSSWQPVCDIQCTNYSLMQLGLHPINANGYNLANTIYTLHDGQQHSIILTASGFTYLQTLSVHYSRHRRYEGTTMNSPLRAGSYIYPTVSIYFVTGSNPSLTG